MKHALKEVVGGAIVTNRPIGALLLRRAALVVTFHRVLPDVGDPLTVTTQQFAVWCDLFSRAFFPVPLDELVARLRRGRPVGGLVAITFDDGYEDNYVHAAPILEAYALPATFFIVTKWIDSNVVAWWDRSAPRSYPWMTWNQVQSLRRRGFDIGAHTQSHVDLGATAAADARSEIFGSRADVERALGEPAGAFAFPYGRRANISDAYRQLVREAGFTCCCSAYGGVNRRGGDPFTLMRVPINALSPSLSDLGFDIAFGRTLHRV